MNKIEIKAPRVDVNDDIVKLGSWQVNNGSSVHQGQVLVSVESSKGTLECEAPAAGFIYFAEKECTEVMVDCIIALLCSEKDDNLLNEINKTPDHSSEGLENSVQMTEKAAALVKMHQIPLSKLPHDRIIREKDVLELIKPQFNIAETKTNKVIMLAGGGHAKMCIDILRQKAEYEIVGITDPLYPKLDKVQGVKVIGNDDILPDYFQKGYRKMINGLGTEKNTLLRRKIFEKYKSMGFEFPNLIHQKSIVEPSAHMEEGNQVMAGAIIGSSVQVGSNCIINSGAIVSHDCKICDHVHIAPGAILAGNVTVGENTLIGMGVTVFFGITIGKNVIINNGCHIFKNIPDDTVVKQSN